MPIRAVVEGAMLAGLTTLLALLGIYIVPLAFITNLIWTIPIVVAIVRHDWKTGVLSLTVAGIIIGLFTGVMQAFLLVLQFGGLAIVLGLAFKKKWGFARTFLLGSFVATLSLVTLLWAMTWLTGFSPAMLEAEFGQTFEQAFEYYKEQGILERYAQQGISEEQLRQQGMAVFEAFKRLIPGMLLLTGMVTVATNLFISRSVLKRLGAPVMTYVPFAEWRLPWYLIWGFIIGLACFLAGDYWKAEALTKTGLNILFVYYPVLLVLGTSVITFFWRRMPINRFLRTFLLVFAILYINVTLLFVTLVGLFDLVGNFRQKWDRPTQT